MKGCTTGRVLRVCGFNGEVISAISTGAGNPGNRHGETTMGTSPLMDSANKIEELKGVIVERRSAEAIARAIEAVEAIPQCHRDVLVWTEAKLIDMVQQGRRLIRLHEQGRW